MANNPRRANGTARDKVVAQVKREEHICAICRRDVDTSLPAGRDDSPEVDEIIPVSKGGSPLERSNLQLTHRLCNRKRSNRPMNAPRVRQLQPLKTTRKW